ncbi:MAG: YggS family pyridoxal phosphate-dependent enzyme [Ruminococcaceae bacterium]|nr:YggS family pyridoxal phosphate-dependent enzyme [Oscillospiraceae bacterium]
MTRIKENLDSVLKRIEDACERSGRKAEDITLLAVTKTVTAEPMRELAGLGVTSFGENRVQSLLEKYGDFPDISWHLIGHLQTNKVKSIIGKVDLIHSVESVRLAEEIGKQSVKAGVVTDILIEVNVSGEESKFGICMDEIDEMLDKCSRIDGIFVKGLMTMAPLDAQDTEIREIFSSLYKKYIDISTKKYDNISMEYLSMGMSNDFEIAIEEGANIVRVGRGLFR